MKLKERTVPPEAAVSSPSERRIGTVPALILSLLLGFLSADTKLGGNGAPLCTAAAAVLPAGGGIAAFAGAMGAFFLRDMVSSRVTEIISIPAVIVTKAALSSALGKKASPAALGWLAAAAYIICGVVAAFVYNITAALVMAVIFRGIVSGGAAYFASKLSARVKDGGGITPEAAADAAAVYILSLCMLCGITIGPFNLGRTAGSFVSAAAAFGYGFTGGAAAGVLSAFAYGVASPSMTVSAATAACSALASGYFAKKSKLSLAAAYIVTALAGVLFSGMPTDGARLLSDVTAGAALFYILPERLYRKPFGRTAAPFSAAAGLFARRLSFAADSVADVRESFSKAARVLEKSDTVRDISEAVRKKLCRGCRSGAFCGGGEEQRAESVFRPAERLLRQKGFLTERELPDGLDHCPKRKELAEGFNRIYRLEQLERQLGDMNGSMRELALDWLSETEAQLNYMASGSETFAHCNETLSEYVREELCGSGAKAVSAAAFSDRDGRLYIEVFCRGLEAGAAERLTERLSELCGRELDNPVTSSVNGLFHVRWHEPAVYEAEIGRAAASGGTEPSGDSDCVFRDGLGNVCILLSDGMGSGVRAAAESRMTVSVMTRMIRAGLGAEAAVQMINSLLMTKSPEEIFSTLDFMKINLFTGRTEIVKLGAAQTFIKTNGTVKTVEGRSTPVGIVSGAETDRRSVLLSDGDQAVMITDGIPEDCFPRVRELMLSIGVTAKDCAERILAEAEKGKPDDPLCRDDKTVYVVKIHKV